LYHKKGDLGFQLEFTKFTKLEADAAKADAKVNAETKTEPFAVGQNPGRHVNLGTELNLCRY